MPTQTSQAHPIVAMREGVRSLSAHAADTRQQGEAGAAQARDAIEMLAQLDIENVIGHVRRMVELVNAPTEDGESATPQYFAQAAE